MLPATQIREGMIIIYNGEPHRLTKVSHVTPGKGRGMVQSKMKNLKTGSLVEYRFRSDEKVEKAFMDHQEMEYLYNTEDEFFFMNTETYEQISLSKEDLGDNVYYLTPNIRFTVSLYEGTPVGVEPPQVVELKVEETAPELKGATAASSLKPATMETGLIVSVPPFIEVGQKLRIDTREGKYIERAK